MWDDLLGDVGTSLVQDLWDLVTIFLFAPDPVCSGEPWLQGVAEDLMTMKGAA